MGVFGRKLWNLAVPKFINKLKGVIAAPQRNRKGGSRRFEMPTIKLPELELK